MSSTSELIARIESAFDQRAEIHPGNAPAALVADIDLAIDGLEQGRWRVAERTDTGGWQVNEWLKKAVLLYFRVSANRCMPAQEGDRGLLQAWDKVPLRVIESNEAHWAAREGVRVVPGAIVRRGSCIRRDVVLMPSFVNIGAYIGEGTMVDTWATVGSCAQIGRGVHISGGAGIGGVLEPLQAAPTIIEDDCFIGARSEVVEGVVVEQGSVIGMGVFLGQSTRIYNRMTGEVSYGRVPTGSVVVSGSLSAKDGSHSLYAAIIVKQVDAKTRAKVGINALLRGGDE